MQTFKRKNAIAVCISLFFLSLKWTVTKRISFCFSQEKHTCTATHTGTYTHTTIHTDIFDPTMAQFKPSYTNPNTNSKAYCLSLSFLNTYLIFLLPSLSLSCLLPFTLSFCRSVCLFYVHTLSRTHAQRFALSSSLSGDCHGVMQSFN